MRWRKINRAKKFCTSCNNHGSDPWATGCRLHNAHVRELIAEEKVKEATDEMLDEALESNEEVVSSYACGV